MTGIYKIESPTGKVYVGQSVQVESRLRQYKKLNNCNEQSKLFNSLKYHGADEHSFEVVLKLREDVCKEWLTYWEQFFMNYYRSEGVELMNLREAGSRGKASEETKLKMRLSHIGLPLPIQFYQKKSGFKHSQESKDKIRRTRLLRKSHFKAVLQYSKNGEFIKEWDSVKSAGLGVKIPDTNISKCCKHPNKTAAGFVWKYKSIVNAD